MRWRSDNYRKWVSSLPCARCHSLAGSQCHHIKGVGHLSGAGLKAPDQFSMPLCVECHAEIHTKSHPDVVRCQWEWVARTQAAFTEQMASALGASEVENIVNLVRDSSWDG